MTKNKSLLSVEHSKLPKNISVDERAVHARIQTRVESLRYRDRRGALARLFDRFQINILPR
jgi:hypothetical protein